LNICLSSFDTREIVGHNSLKIHFAQKPSQFETNYILTLILMFVGKAGDKVLKFIMPLLLVYIRNFGFIEQKCIFEKDRKVKN